jgi:hypothetical protein
MKFLGILFIIFSSGMSCLLPAQVYQPAEIISLSALTNQIQYPEKARETGVSGKVLVRVWVNEDSTVTLDRIIRTPDSSLSAEVISKLYLLKGIPARKEGTYLREAVTFPLLFELAEEKLTFLQQMESLKWECLPSGLCYAWIRASGNGSLQKNKMAAMHYTGFLENGKVFDSSKNGKAKPFLVMIGKSNLIAGWEEALSFLAPGDRVWLKIPPDLGYGSRDMEGIPGNSVLYFDLEVLERF